MRVYTAPSCFQGHLKPVTLLSFHLPKTTMEAGTIYLENKMLRSRDKVLSL